MAPLLTQRLLGILTRPENRLAARAGGRNPSAVFRSASYYPPFSGTNSQLNVSTPTYVHSLLHRLFSRRAIHPHGPDRIARSVGNVDNVSATALRRSGFPRACVSKRRSGLFVIRSHRYAACLTTCCSCSSSHCLRQTPPP